MPLLFDVQPYRFLNNTQGDVMVNNNRVLAELNEYIKRGNYLQAIELANRSIAKNDDILLRKPLALALSRMGHTGEALEALKPLMKEADPETNGLVGGILKHNWLTTGKIEFLEDSYQFYLKAFREGKDYWTGINAATLARVMDRDVSQSLAEEVLNICWAEYERLGTRSSFWLLVSIAEAHLVKGDVVTAVKWYKLVMPMAYKSVGQIKTVRRNARMLGEKLGQEALAKLMDAICAPRVAFFAGHRIDRKGMSPRFPQKESEVVKKKLRATLGKLRISVGVASLADGADILFHECLIEAGRQCRVILPSPVEDFRKRLEADDPGGWVERFDKVLKAASAVEIVSNSVFTQDWGIVYELATDYMIGYAMNLAREFDGEIVPLVVWDKKMQSKRGGTYSAVKKLRSLGYEPEVITVFPKSLSNYTGNSKSRSRKNRRTGYVPSMNAFVVVGVGKEIRNDDEIAGALSRYIKTVAEITSSSNTLPVKRSLSGKEICLAFADLLSANQFIQAFRKLQPESCIFAHVGLSVRFDVSLSRAGDFYSPALIEDISLVRELSPAQTFCTTAFRSLSILIESDPFQYTYRGQFSIADREIKIFEMNL
ncbi:MAG: DUF4071 domain-containing protein [Candidatus Sabulitectum sp.]|nr:DUF4071 domain-containing protein [Candidatus Sabulitectum sp.]